MQILSVSIYRKAKHKAKSFTSTIKYMMKTTGLILIAVAVLAGCTSTKKAGYSAVGTDSQVTRQMRLVPGAQLTKEEAKQIERQRKNVDGEIRLNDKKHNSRLNKIHDGLDLFNRLRRLR
ncbi:MAG: hypothetical protein P1V20_29710 [Verrucomicrobiales bacterium]|nr:hypothetical protein [Verrucomicrobiales bacterium]